jgi:hypothetical protein
MLAMVFYLPRKRKPSACIAKIVALTSRIPLRVNGRGRGWCRRLETDAELARNALCRQGFQAQFDNTPTRADERF